MVVDDSNMHRACLAHRGAVQVTDYLASMRMFLSVTGLPHSAFSVSKVSAFDAKERYSSLGWCPPGGGTGNILGQRNQLRGYCSRPDTGQI